ncbi:MAG TPA: hypothetical protein ENH62_10125 [Marinobacter sp.]|uniref:Uncharacterized protein n=1 Tax=marine sediment metagenome TaxID=412755 RepID=A0A0F9PCH1_9ZZZZ|nr:hypothetical protein [Marinobacter sp.]
MADLTNRIRNAQIRAREDAAIRGASLGEIQMAGVGAAEQIVVGDVRRMEAEALAQIESRK